MNLTALGLNHNTAPVELREKLSFSPEEIPHALSTIRRSLPDLEVVILSTCNRCEVYAFRREAPPPEDELRRLLAEMKELRVEEISPHLYTHTGVEAARHLFMVASGLDSMVVGETEIKAQVQAAYSLASRHGATGKLLNRLFEIALRTAKEVHHNTSITTRRVSVGSVALEFAEKIFQDFSDKMVLIIGAGQAGESTLKSLMDRGITKVIVANRNSEKAAELAAKYGGKGISLDLLEDYLPRADVVISSTASPNYLIGPELVKSAMKQRHNRPMLILDIAVPRDVNPEVNGIANVYVCNIDDLKATADANRRLREKETESGIRIVDKRVETFVRAVNQMDVAPTIAKLSDAMHTIMRNELDRVFPKLSHLSEKDKQELTYMAERIIHKILHGPVETLTQKAHDGEGHWYTETIKRLFRLGD